MTYEAPVLKVEVALDASHLDDPDTLTYTDLSARVMGFSWTAGRSDQTGKFATGSITITLDNTDRELDPLNSDGLVPVADDLGLPLCPARIRMTYKGGTYDVIARGFLGPEGWPVNRSAHGTDSTVTLTVFDPTAAMAWVDMSPSPWLALVAALDPDWWVPGEVASKTITGDGYELPNRSGSGGAAVTASSEVRTVTDAVTAVDYTLTSATAGFRFDDVGRPVSGAGIPVPCVISEVVSATDVVLSDATTAAASGVTVTIGVAVPEPVVTLDPLSKLDKAGEIQNIIDLNSIWITRPASAFGIAPLVRVVSAEADVFPDGDLPAYAVSLMWEAHNYDNGSLAGTGQAEIFTVTSGADRCLRCWIDGDDGGALKLTVYDGAGAELTTMVAPPPTTAGFYSYGDNYDDGAAHGITVRVVGGTSVDLFVDGEQVTELVDVPADAFAGDLVLGVVPVGSYPTAAFDELLVFHRALTDNDCVRLSSAPTTGFTWGRGDTPAERLAYFYAAAQWFTLTDEYDETHPPPVSIVSPDPTVTLVGVEEASTWPQTLGAAVVDVADAIAGDAYALRDGRVRVRSLLALDDPTLAATYATPTAHFTDEPSPDPDPTPLRRGPLTLSGTRLDRVVTSAAVEFVAITGDETGGAYSTTGIVRQDRASRFGRREKSIKVRTESRAVAEALTTAVLDRYAAPPVELSAVPLYPHLDTGDDGALMDWLVQTMELEIPVALTDTPPVGDPIVWDVLNVQGWNWSAGPGTAMSVTLNLAKS